MKGMPTFYPLGWYAGRSGNPFAGAFFLIGNTVLL